MIKSPLRALSALSAVLALISMLFHPVLAQAAVEYSTSPFPMLPRPFKLSRAQQIFDQTWEIIRANYVDPGFNGLDWDAIRAEYRFRISTAQSWQDFYPLMMEMVGRLNDGHSAFLPPRQASALQSYRLGSGKSAIVGLAANLRKMPDQSLLVLQVIPNSQTEAVIKPGDRIVAIEGVRLDREDRSHLLYGEAGLVRFTVQPPGGAPREVSIERETYTAAQMPPPVVARRLPNDIGYLAIYDFLSFTAAMRVREGVMSLLRGGPLNGLIVDVRANDGGIIGQMVSVLGLFINGGTAGAYVDRSGEVDHYPIPRGRTIRALEDVPIVVLTGPSTNSSGDIFAVVMQASKRGRVIGMPTPGNVEMLQAFHLLDESMLWIAVKHYRAPDGRLIEGIGVQPDRVVAADWWRYALLHDPQIQAAMAELARR